MEQSVSGSEVKDSAEKPVEIVAYDFDGTCISSDSPVLLVFQLMRARRLGLSVLIRIACWAFAYKLRLPQNEAWVRELVFRAFQDRPQKQVDDYLAEFYNKKIDCCFRPEIEASMLEHKKAGRVVMIVSASFDPIVECALKNHPIDYQISTKMAVNSEGLYIDKVVGVPVEGEQKPRVIAEFADKKLDRKSTRLNSSH